jgi:hypothetical protein
VTEQETIKILQDQIQALKDLVLIKEQIIVELKNKSVAPINLNPVPLFPSQPFIVTIPCNHEYPFPWHSITPPPCKKCGQSAPSYQITCSSNAQSNLCLVDSTH